MRRFGRLSTDDRDAGGPQMSPTCIVFYQSSAIPTPGKYRCKICCAVRPSSAIWYAPHWDRPTPWPKPRPLKVTASPSSVTLSISVLFSLFAPICRRKEGAETAFPLISITLARPDSPFSPSSTVFTSPTRTPVSAQAFATWARVKVAVHALTLSGALSDSSDAAGFRYSGSPPLSCHLCDARYTPSPDR